MVDALLLNVDPEKEFYFCTGEKASTIKELLDVVSSLDSRSFEQHVTLSRNDFSNWIRDVVGDEQLARDVDDTSQRKVIALLRARIRFLEYNST